MHTIAGLGTITVPATILINDNLSDAIDLGPNYRATRFTMPPAWTAATLSFQISVDGLTYNEMRDDTLQPISVGAAASYDFAVNRDVWAGIRYIRIRSGTAASPVAQLGTRSIVITKVPA